MTTLQKTSIRASEIRARLAELAGVEELGDEHRAEIGKLRNEYKDVELRIQAATVGDDGEGEREPESEGDPQLADLEARASAGEVFAAAVSHGQTGGATKELQEHLGLAGNVVPLALLRQPDEERAVTPAPSDVGTNQQPIIPAVFPDSVAAFLGIEMPTVGSGETVFPVLTTSASVKTPLENAEADETTGAFSADVLSPARLQASFFFSREDRARFAGMDVALRQNLSEALSDKLDKEIIGGDKGLLGGTNLANHNVSSEADFEEYLSHFGWARVDGKFANSSMDLRIVVGSATYGHAGETYAGTASNKGDLSAVEKLMDITSGVRVSAHVPDAAANKQNAVIRLGMRRDMVSAIWQGVTLISDEISLAKRGQIAITAVMLHAIKILRKEAFHKQESQHA